MFKAARIYSWKRPRCISKQWKSAFKLLECVCERDKLIWHKKGHCFGIAQFKTRIKEIQQIAIIRLRKWYPECFWAVSRPAEWHHGHWTASRKKKNDFGRKRSWACFRYFTPNCQGDGDDVKLIIEARGNSCRSWTFDLLRRFFAFFIGKVSFSSFHSCLFL